MSVAALTRPLAAMDAGDHAETVWLHTADTLACLAAAHATREGAAIAALYPGADPAGQAALVRFTECDAIHVPSCLTPAAVVVPAALAEARDAEAYLRAVAAGYATGLALAEAVGGAAALAHGVWPTLLAAPAMAAASAAVARGADGEILEAAVALSLTGASGRAGRPGGMPSGRWLAVGEATRKGLSAAVAAEAGARGDPALISEAWLAAQAGPGLARPAALEQVDPGAVGRTGLKPFVSARQACAAIAAMLQARSAAGAAAEDVLEVEAFLPPVTLGVVTRPLEPGNRLSEIANLPVQLGLAAHAPARLLDVGRETPLPPEVVDFAAKVTVTGDPDLDTGDGRWPARLVLRTLDGIVTHRVDRLPGDPDDPDRAGTLRRKVHALGAAEVGRLLDRIEAGAAASELLAAARTLATAPTTEEGQRRATVH